MAYDYKEQPIVVWDLAKERGSLDDLSFKDCLITGPAVLLLHGDLTLGNCTFIGDEYGEAENGAMMFWEVPVDRVLVLGVISAKNTIFLGCVFEGIGVASSGDTLRAIKDSMAKGNMNNG